MIEKQYSKNVEESSENELDPAVEFDRRNADRDSNRRQPTSYATVTLQPPKLNFIAVANQPSLSRQRTGVASSSLHWKRIVAHLHFRKEGGR